MLGRRGGGAVDMVFIESRMPSARVAASSSRHEDSCRWPNRTLVRTAPQVGAAVRAGRSGVWSWLLGEAVTVVAVGITAHAEHRVGGEAAPSIFADRCQGKSLA